MTSSSPLFTGIYSINGRNYRKTPYQIKIQTEIEETTGRQATDQFEDTPDIYEDEPAAGCMAPPGLPALKNTAKKAKIEKVPAPAVNQDPQPTEDQRIQVIGGKKWIAIISVPQCFIGKLVGTNRRSLNALENETQCRVKTPRRDENKPCEISSISSLESVQRCLDRIEILLDDARKNARVSHFVAFPCTDPEVLENFKIFKEMVLDSNHFDDSCKNPLLFAKPARLHLTLSVLRIFDDVDLEKAKEALKIVETEVKDILKSSPLTAEIQGIDMMNDDPSQVSVIYAKVGGANVQKVADHVNKRLHELGIGDNEGDGEVKLHMTIMNARFVAQAENRKRFTFDATRLLEDLKDSYFGTIPLNEICLCPLSSSTTGDKFYDVLAKIQI